MSTYLIENDVVNVSLRIHRTPDGWVLPAMSEPLRNPETLTADTVTALREKVAQLAWERVTSGILPVNPTKVSAIRLFTTVATVHPRNGDTDGPMIQVQAVAHRPGGQWQASVAGNCGALAACTASGETFAEMSHALVSAVMLELEMAGSAVAETWSGIELQVASRKTFPVSGLA